jgi:hypothetical protein
MTNQPSSSLEQSVQNLELSAAIPVSLTHISVKYTGEGLEDSLLNFASGVVNEIERNSPNLAEREEFDKNQLAEYFKWLIKKRVDAVNDQLQKPRNYKLVWIPVFIETMLSSIGHYYDRDRGIDYMPVADVHVSISDDEAFAISKKLATAERAIHLIQGMPLDPEGDRDVMMCAIIADVVQSASVVPPVKALIAAWLGQAIDQKYELLYRYQYDKVEYLLAALDSVESRVI